jgi:hypothetical protein
MGRSAACIGIFGCCEATYCFSCKFFGSDPFTSIALFSYNFIYSRFSAYTFFSPACAFASYTNFRVRSAFPVPRSSLSSSSSLVFCIS